MAYQFKYRKIAKALYDALLADAFYYTMEASISNKVEIAKEGMYQYYDFSMQEAEKYGELFFPIGNVCGAAIWSNPIDNEAIAQQKKKEKNNFILEYLGQSSLEKYIEITESMSQQTATVLTENAWYLSILGLQPISQNKGFGQALVQQAFQDTDQMGFPTYLETFTARNISFYKRLGYKEVGAFEAKGTGATYWVMLRGVGYVWR